MFEEINGLPAHPLVVHAAVVLVPLFCLAVLVYALIPRTRRATWWGMVGLAILAPAAAFLATRTGESLLETSYPDQVPDVLYDHEEFGEATLFGSLALAVVSLVLVYLTRPAVGRRLPSWVSWVLAAIAVVLALVTGFYVVQTGDSGARSVWG